MLFKMQTESASLLEEKGLCTHLTVAQPARVHNTFSCHRSSSIPLQAYCHIKVLLSAGGYGGRGDFSGGRPRGEPGYGGGRGGGRANGAPRGGYEGGRSYGGRSTNINVDDQSAFPTLG